MYLETLKIQNFRNILDEKVDFSSRLNLITGDNGEGKTNLLEAVGVLASGRSFRRATSSVMRMFDQPWFRLQGNIAAHGLEHQLVFFGQGRRQVAQLNGKVLSSLSKMGSTLAGIIYTPETIQLVTGSPQQRRAFIDWAIYLRFAGYVEIARTFKRALRSRSMLLKKGGRDLREMAAWENQLAESAAEIVFQRRLILEDLREPLIERLKTLKMKSEHFHLRWRGHFAKEIEKFSDRALIAENYQRLLMQNREQDQRMGSTRLGPHCDDLEFKMGRASLARCGSRGEQKRFVLALKLAEADLLREKWQENPLYILDDPASELDEEGLAALMDILHDQEAQIFLTARQSEKIPWKGETCNRFLVKAGLFQPIHV
ncbi:DNA replication/repair protein RecF [Magnetococcales bacterium HHB-1]